MAALLQKLVEKKEDVTLLLVEKRGVLLERIPKEVEVRQMIWDKKPHPGFGTELWENGRHRQNGHFYGQRNGRISDAASSMERNGMENCMNGFWSVWSRKQNNTILFSTFSDSVRSQPHSEPERRMQRKKAVWFHGENLWWLFRTRDFIPEYDKIYCVSEPVRKQVIARFPELADRTRGSAEFH